jgi:hypothetical protein
VGQQYNVKVVKLAWDIAQLIKKAEATQAATSRVSATLPSKPTAYLAHCAYDRREAREAIEAELTVQGYRVVPQDRLPDEEEDFRAEVRRVLGTCQLSIHLVGGAYGASPDGPTEKSMVMLQNELAVERSIKRDQGRDHVHAAVAQHLPRLRHVMLLVEDGGAAVGGAAEAREPAAKIPELDGCPS